MARHPVIRGAVITVVVLALIAAGIVGGLWVWKNHFQESTATGLYATEPAPVRDISPKDFGMSTFVPLTGDGNSVAPVTFDDYQIVAGETAQGATVLMSLADEGTSLWQTQFPASLVACSRTAMGKFLPCVFTVSDGQAVAKVDIASGHSHWIYFTPDPIINVVADSDSSMLLLGKDMSIFSVDSSGNQLSEPMKQLSADPGQAADLSACDKPTKATITSPERFQVLSDHALLVTHNGLTQMLDRDNNQVLASTVGNVLQGYEPTQAKEVADSNNDKGGDKTAQDLSQDDAHKHDIVVAPADGCAPSLLINPQSRRAIFLPDDVIVPYTENDHIPAHIIRDGNFYTINWRTPTIGSALNNPDHQYFQGSPFIAHGATTSVAVTDDSVIGIDNNTRAVAWQASTPARYATIIGDVALVVGRDGTMQGLSLADGQTAWSMSISGTAPIVLGDNNTVSMYTPSSFTSWAPQQGDTPPQVQTGQSTKTRDVKPGIDFEAGDCVRVAKVSGSDKQYKAQFTKVSCDLVGAETVVDIISSSDIKRDSPPEKFLNYCEKNEDAYSALTLNNEFVATGLSGICTGKPAAGTAPAADD